MLNINLNPNPETFKMSMYSISELDSPRFRIVSRVSKYQDSLHGSRERDSCPQPFTPYLDKCHYIINTEASWYSGCESCSNLGAHLYVMPNDDNNEKVLKQYLLGKNLTQKLGDFVWVGSSASCTSGKEKKLMVRMIETDIKNLHNGYFSKSSLSEVWFKTIPKNS